MSKALKGNTRFLFGRSADPIIFGVELRGLNAQTGRDAITGRQSIHEFLSVGDAEEKISDDGNVEASDDARLHVAEEVREFGHQLPPLSALAIERVGS